MNSCEKRFPSQPFHMICPERVLANDRFQQKATQKRRLSHRQVEPTHTADRPLTKLQSFTFHRADLKRRTVRQAPPRRRSRLRREGCHHCLQLHDGTRTPGVPCSPRAKTQTPLRSYSVFDSSGLIPGTISDSSLACFLFKRQTACFCLARLGKPRKSKYAYRRHCPQPIAATKPTRLS